MKFQLRFDLHYLRVIAIAFFYNEKFLTYKVFINHKTWLHNKFDTKFNLSKPFYYH